MSGLKGTTGERRGAALVLVLFLLPLGCVGSQEEREARAEAAALERQVEGLRSITKEAEAGTLLSPRSVAIGVQESVVRDLLNAGLPQEFGVGEHLRIRILDADVSFRGTEGQVTLRGRVVSEGNPDDFADVACSGGIATPRIDAGRLTVQITLDRFEVPRVAAGGKDNSVLRSAADKLGQRALAAVQGGLPPIQIPVHLQQEVNIEGPTDGPVYTASGRIPLSETVTRVVAIQGRLWVLVDVTVGRFQERRGPQ